MKHSHLKHKLSNLTRLFHFTLSTNPNQTTSFHYKLLFKNTLIKLCVVNCQIVLLMAQMKYFNIILPKPLIWREFYNP
jgi:hypothetical protein